MGTQAMVVVSGHHQHYINYLTNFIWRVFCNFTFYLYAFLMFSFKSYKPIWIQVLVFISLGILKKEILFIVLGIILFILPFLSVKSATAYIEILEKIINTTGIWIKNMLFFLLFYIIIFPIRIILNRSITKQTKGYILSDLSDSSTDFEKMW